MTLPLTELFSQFNVEVVSPFGVMIRPRTATAALTAVPVSTARDVARDCHLVIFRGFSGPSTPEQLAGYAAFWGQTLSWPFGEVLELVEHERPADHVFDNTGISLHWDGMFADRIPEFQIFQCINAGHQGQGGRTIFCDTTLVLNHTDTATRQLWKHLTLTYRVNKESHYGGIAVSDLVVNHPTRRFPTIRYLEPVPTNTDYVNRPHVTFHDVPPERIHEIEQTIHDALYDPRHCYAHEWHTDDIVIADNYTLLHGRQPYTTRCGRHLRRVHVLGEPPLRNPALRSSTQ